jgi:predicted Zn-ribbon and HTH transcriptional regulator
VGYKEYNMDFILDADKKREMEKRSITVDKITCICGYEFQVDARKTKTVCPECLRKFQRF